VTITVRYRCTSKLDESPTFLLLYMSAPVPPFPEFFFENMGHASRGRGSSIAVNHAGTQKRKIIQYIIIEHRYCATTGQLYDIIGDL